MGVGKDLQPAADGFDVPFDALSDDFKAPLVSPPLSSHRDEAPESQSAQLIWGVPAIDALWLFIFCSTGIGLGMAYEFLDLHSRDHTPAAAETFFLCFIGYWAQTLVGAAYAFTVPNVLRGAWTRKIFILLAISALFDGGAQALDFVGQVNGGYLLFTIFHSSVTVFSCIIAVFLLKAAVTWQQWCGVLLIVFGVLVTTIPSPLEVTGNFFIGLVCSLSGSLCLAASYPFSELVFVTGETEASGPITEEAACVVGSLLNTFLFTVWTLAYTLPRWQSEVVHYTKPGNGPYKVAGFVIYGAMVGLHSLSFWKSIYKMGTVPTAVAKGAQQAGVFIFSHLIFCSLDESECIDYNYGNSLWNKMQKSVAFLLCCGGVMVYALNKRKSSHHRQGSGDGGPGANNPIHVAIE